MKGSGSFLKKNQKAFALRGEIFQVDVRRRQSFCFFFQKEALS
jgi:hypothetical protein